MKNIRIMTFTYTYVRNALKLLSEKRTESERKKIPLLKIIKRANFFVAELYPRLMQFIINYMVVIYLYEMFKKLAILMKNA